jgi:hypothetical protein
MAESQSFKNHTRFDPTFHFTTLPVLLMNIGFSIYYTIKHWPAHHHLGIWWIVMSFTLLIMAGSARAAAIRAQDRVIRLEEKLRLAALVSPHELAELDSLTMKQYIALRFASNPELPELARRAIREKLDQKQIKQSIMSWRADDYRV